MYLGMDKDEYEYIQEAIKEIDDILRKENSTLSEATGFVYPTTTVSITRTSFILRVKKTFKCIGPLSTIQDNNDFITFLFAVQPFKLPRRM